MVDLYATLGIYKRSETRQVQQRRPEVSLDYRPWKNENFELLQYNLVMLPFQRRDEDPEQQERNAAKVASTSSAWRRSSKRRTSWKA